MAPLPCYLVHFVDHKKQIVQFLILDGQLGQERSPQKNGIGHSFPEEEVYSTDEKKLFFLMLRVAIRK